MEPITHGAKRSQQEHHRPFLKLLLYALLLFAAAMTVMIVGARAMTGESAAPLNVFSPYMDVFPGQPRSAVVARGFSCPMTDYGTYSGSANVYCALNLREGIFSHVGVVIGRNVVLRIDFTMRGSTLRAGDLMVLWGKPHIREDRYAAHFYWADGTIASVRTGSRAGRYSPFLPVHNFSFTAASGQLLSSSA